MNDLDVNVGEMVSIFANDTKIGGGGKLPKTPFYQILIFNCYLNHTESHGIPQLLDQPYHLS